MPASRVLTFLAALPLAATPVYVLTDIGAPGTGSAGYAINASGHVAGVWQDASGAYLAFAASPATGALILPAGSVESRASGINYSGAVAGTTQWLSGARATVWNGADVMIMGTFGGADSYATAINDAGQVTGNAADQTGRARAFVYTCGAMQDLGVLSGGSWSAGYSINGAGQIAGTGDVAAGRFRAFRGSVSGLAPLGTLGGLSSYGMAINNAGMIAGHSQVASGYTHAFLHNGSSMIDLGTLGGGNSYAFGLNSAADAVGYSLLAGNLTTHAFMYRNGVMFDLNSLLESPAGWELIEAYGINDEGQITGAGMFEGHMRAFRLDPQPNVSVESAVPEPSTHVLAGAILAGLALAKARKRS